MLYVFFLCVCVCVVGFTLFLLAVAVSMATDSCDPRSSFVGHLNAGTQDDGSVETCSQRKRGKKAEAKLQWPLK